MRGIVIRTACLLLAVAVAGLHATPPTLPEQELRDRAAGEGAAAVREEFRQTTERLRKELEMASDARNSTGFSPRDGAVARLRSWSSCWLEAETQDIRKTGRAPDEFEAEVWQPLWQNMRESDKALRKLVESAARDLKEIESTGNRHQVERARQRARGLKIGLASGDLPFRLAVLAACADRRDLVQKVFDAAGELRDRKGLVYASAAEFMKVDHVRPETPAAPKAQVAGPLDFSDHGKFTQPVELSAEERRAVRQLLDRLYAALRTGDAGKLEREFMAEDRRFVKAAFEQELTAKPFEHVDLSQIRIRAYGIPGRDQQRRIFASPILLREKIDGVTYNTVRMTDLLVEFDEHGTAFVRRVNRAPSDPEPIAPASKK